MEVLLSAPGVQMSSHQRGATFEPLCLNVLGPLRLTVRISDLSFSRL